MLRYSVLFCFLFSFCCVFAQSRQELERQKIQNEKDIIYTNELIAKTEKNKKDLDEYRDAIIILDHK